MSDYLESVRVELAAGGVSPQTLVLLFRAAEEAEERRDLQELEQTLRLAQQAANIADDLLQPEAQRLIGLCEERLERTRAASAAGPSDDGPSACPGCGRPLLERAVRCRACGTLLV